MRYNGWAIRYGSYRMGRGVAYSRRNRDAPPSPGRAGIIVAGIITTLVFVPFWWLFWGTIGLVFPIVATVFVWLMILNGLHDG